MFLEQKAECGMKKKFQNTNPKILPYGQIVW